MKTIATILLIASCSLFSRSSAQRTIFSEDFQYYSQINFIYPWAAINNPTAFPWRCDYAYLVYGTGFYFNNATKLAIVASNSSDSNVLLVTPAINFSTVQGAFLQYDSYFRGRQNSGKTESATVEVTTDNGLSWTILQHAPAIAGGPDMKRSYIDLSAYNNVPSLRFGFRYSDSGKNMGGWMVDNIKAFIPEPADLALIHANPQDSMLSYYATPASVTLSGTVMNMGTTPVTAFTVNFREGTGPVQSHTVTGVNIPAFDTLDFIHSVPTSILTATKHNLKMWVSMPLDTNHRNDTLGLSVHGAQFIPKKKVTVEEGTGTWNGYGPRGAVLMHALDNADDMPVRVSVHTADPMANTVYKDYLYALNQNFTPYFLFDRRGPVRPEVFFERYELFRNYFGFADINVKGTTSGNQVSVTATITPAINLAGDYRLALVLTEDGLKGTDTTYNQWNFFAGGALGPMGGYEALPNPVPAASMTYDYVARSIAPDPAGKVGCLPVAMQAGNNYSCTLTASTLASWKRDKLKVAVLLLRASDSSILNSKMVALNALGLDEFAENHGSLTVFPNPAADAATLAFDLPSRSLVSITATDIAGRTIYQSPEGWMESGKHTLSIPVSTLTAGMYFITMQAGSSRQSVKLSVVH